MEVPKDCFVCLMAAMEQDLLAAEATNWEFVNETFGRLKATCKEYGDSGREQLKLSVCTLHLGKRAERVTKALWKVVELLLSSFGELNQRDGSLAAELLHIAYYFTHSYRNFLRLCTFSCRGHIALGKMLSVIEFRHLMRVSYSAKHPTSLEGRTECDDVQHVLWFAIQENQEHLLSGLLRCGVMLLPAQVFVGRYFVEIYAAVKCLDGHTTRTFTFTSQTGAQEVFRRELGWPQHRVMIVLKVMQLVSIATCKRAHYDMEEISERKTPRLEVIGPLGSGFTLGLELFRCVRHLFETIPEPFVTSQELRRIFQASCGNMDESTESLIDGKLALFERWYPDGAGPLSPRTLQHLSRCQVRQNLRQTGSLPHGVKHLEIPIKLRKYLLLEE